MCISVVTLGLAFGGNVALAKEKSEDPSGFSKGKKKGWEGQLPPGLAKKESKNMDVNKGATTVKPELAKQDKKTEKEAKKAQKKAEKDAKKAEKEAKKAQKKAEKEAKKAKKEAEKAQKKAEKESAKNAKKLGL